MAKLILIPSFPIDRDKIDTLLGISDFSAEFDHFNNRFIFEEEEEMLDELEREVTNYLNGFPVNYRFESEV